MSRWEQLLRFEALQGLLVRYESRELSYQDFCDCALSQLRPIRAAAIEESGFVEKTEEELQLELSAAEQNHRASMEHLRLASLQVTRLVEERCAYENRLSALRDQTRDATERLHRKQQAAREVVQGVQRKLQTGREIVSELSERVESLRAERLQREASLSERRGALQAELTEKREKCQRRQKENAELAAGNEAQALSLQKKLQRTRETAVQDVEALYVELQKTEKAFQEAQEERQKAQQEREKRAGYLEFQEQLLREARHSFPAELQQHKLEYDARIRELDAALKQQQDVALRPKTEHRRIETFKTNQILGIKMQKIPPTEENAAEYERLQGEQLQAVQAKADDSRVQDEREVVLCRARNVLSEELEKVEKEIAALRDAEKNNVKVQELARLRKVSAFQETQIQRLLERFGRGKERQGYQRLEIRLEAPRGANAARK